MATQFFFQVEDKAGSLHDITAVLEKAGINIDGVAGFGINGKGWVWFVTNKTKETVSCLKNAGINFSQEDVFYTNLANKPGSLNLMVNEFNSEGINLKSLYITMDGYQVIGTNNNKKAIEIATKHGYLANVNV